MKTSSKTCNDTSNSWINWPPRILNQTQKRPNRSGLKVCGGVPCPCHGRLQADCNPTIAAKSAEKTPSSSTKSTSEHKGDTTTVNDGTSSQEPVETTENNEDNDNPPQLYFQTPQQLLDIFAELEENNLALIQNCQETEETLEELKKKIAETEERMWAEFTSLSSILCHDLKA